MKYLIVFAILGYFTASALAASYYRSASPSRSQNRRAFAASRPSYNDAASSYESGGITVEESPSPYNFIYNVDDTEASQERSESGDENGNIKGSYSYRDANGVYRKVDYTAGPDGFHAVVSSNEPGLGSTDNPADVTLNVQEPPANAYNVPKKNRAASRNSYPRNNNY